MSVSSDSGIGGGTGTGSDTAAGDFDYAMRTSERIYDGRVIALRKDTVAMPGGTESVREVVEHPGAVGVVVLRDDGAVLLIRQYRHPVGGYLQELPAGLLDVEGEPALETAQRELAEEAGLQATTWHTLVDTRPSPGMSSEAVRVFLARGVSELPEGRPEAQHEEADLTERWVPLADAVAEVQRGEITNALAVAGLLAAGIAVRDDFAGLRPADTHWPARPGR